MPGCRLYVFYILMTCLMRRWVTGFSSGPPKDACGDMIPQHSGIPRTQNAPYVVNVTSTIYDEGSRIRVKIYGLNTHFKGFMLKAVNAQNESVGTFAAHPNTRQICPDHQGIYHATGHTTGSLKRDVEVDWIAPSTIKGKIAIRATIVQSFNVYWVQQYSPVIFPNVTTTSTSTTTTTTPFIADITTINTSMGFSTGSTGGSPPGEDPHEGHDHDDHGSNSSNRTHIEMLLCVFSVLISILMYSL